MMAKPLIKNTDQDESATPLETKVADISNRPIVETWEVPLQEIFNNSDVRLDASHYDRNTAQALCQLRESGCCLKSLSEIATVLLPGQFVRVWAKDKHYGIPYVNATDLMSLTSIGLFEGNIRYLSKQTKVDFNELTIHEGWILMTCSGTIGRVFYVPKRLDQWVATHDLIRIIPKKKEYVGFLHAYLSLPVAQKQILGYTHGGQIDHITHNQVGSILVPMLDENKVVSIHKRTIQALKMREKFVNVLEKIAEDTAKDILG